MPNFMLTSRCNFNCDYCFGKDFMSSAPNKDMSWDVFNGLLEWLQRVPFPGNSIHLMGGEPTLHPEFIDMVTTVLDIKMEIQVFSNLATNNAPGFSEELKDEDIKWIVNVNPPASRSKRQDENLKKSLAVLGEKVVLTFNMRPKPTEHRWVMDLICEYGLKKSVKVGFVLPTLSHSNTHLKKDEYPIVASRVVEFARDCDNFDISVKYECGIPWCAFTAEQMGQLWRLNSRFHSACNSILDITPDGQVIYCLPLVTLLAVHYTKFETYPAAKARFNSKLAPYRPLGSTYQCHSCNLLRIGICSGGCMARILEGTSNLTKEGGSF